MLVYPNFYMFDKIKLTVIKTAQVSAIGSAKNTANVWFEINNGKNKN